MDHRSPTHYDVVERKTFNADGLDTEIKADKDEELGWAENLWAWTGITTFKLRDLYWGNILKIGLLHAYAIRGLFFLPVIKLFTWYWLGSLLVCGCLSVTAGAHRLWCHRSYKARTPLRTLLMLWNCTVAQNDLYDWVRDHRVHHKFSDTDADPHNIRRGLFFAHVGWLFAKKHPDVTKYGEKIDLQDLVDDPVIRFQTKYYIPLTILFAFTLPTIIPVYFWGEEVWAAGLVCCILRIVFQLNGTWAVNSFAHYYGDKPFDGEMFPSENKWVSALAGGEGFHNYHHVYPFDYSTSELGWFLNMTTIFIDSMAMIGQAYDRKTVSKETILRGKLKSGDGTRIPSIAQRARAKAPEHTK